MTLKFDYFKHEYDNTLPAFVEVDDKHILHRPTNRFLDRPALQDRWRLDGYIPQDGEVGPAPEWLWERFKIGALGGGGGIVDEFPPLGPPIQFISAYIQATGDHRPGNPGVQIPGGRGEIRVTGGTPPYTFTSNLAVTEVEPGVFTWETFWTNSFNIVCVDATGQAVIFFADYTSFSEAGDPVPLIPVAQGAEIMDARPANLPVSNDWLHVMAYDLSDRASPGGGIRRSAVVDVFATSSDLIFTAPGGATAGFGPRLEGTSLVNNPPQNWANRFGVVRDRQNGTWAVFRVYYPEMTDGQRIPQLDVLPTVVSEPVLEDGVYIVDVDFSSARHPVMVQDDIWGPNPLIELVNPSVKSHRFLYPIPSEDTRVTVVVASADGRRSLTNVLLTAVEATLTGTVDETDSLTWHFVTENIATPVTAWFEDTEEEVSNLDVTFSHTFSAPGTWTVEAWDDGNGYASMQVEVVGPTAAASKGV